MKYTYINKDGHRSITALIDGELYTATEDHPMFESIIKDVIDGVATTATFDTTEGVLEYLELADGVSVEDGVLHVDGVPMHSTLANKIIDNLKKGESAESLVNFMALIDTNPSRNSRDQLYDWLEQSGFELTWDGFVVGYKSVNEAETGLYHSISSGTAYSDGVIYSNSTIPQRVNSVVSMPRNEVTDNPGVSCSYGLHVGTKEYAQSFSGDTILKVLVDPADVVSVPNDDATKMRVCKYNVVSAEQKVYEDSYDENLDDEPSDLFYMVQNSSWIHSLTWDHFSLVITTKKGEDIEHYDVPWNVCAALIEADASGDAGSFYNKYIKNLY